MKYFAYGSNLYLPQLKERIAYNDIAEPAILTGYEICFNKRSSKSNVTYANVQPNINKNVYGCLFNLTQEQISRLDDYELGYDKVYVEVLNITTNLVEPAFMYISNPLFVSNLENPPTDYKLKIECGLTIWFGNKINVAEYFNK